MGLIQCHCSQKRRREEKGRERWRRKSRESRQEKGREKESSLVKLILFKAVGIIRTEANKARASPKPEMVLLFHFGERVPLFLSVRPFTNSTGTCHLKLHSLPEPASWPQPQFLPGGPRMTCPDEAL